jgi:FAD:protein FMN transferase
MLRGEFHSMGSKIKLVLDCDSPKGNKLLRLARTWFLEWETSLSRFRADSELSRLNQFSRSTQPERFVELSPVLWEVLTEALKADRRTRGLVSPFILDTLIEAGYDRPFNSKAPFQHFEPPPTQGKSTIIQNEKQIPSAFQDQIVLVPSTHTIWWPKEARIDLGGFAKGWAAGQAARLLGEYCPALVEAGGDVAVNGTRENGRPWNIGVPDPYYPEQNSIVIPLQQGGVATSGSSYRQWRRKGVVQHHIIDPRTGNPAETDLVSVSVVAPSTLEAEIAAKVVFILGSEAGLRWMDSQPELSAYFLYR